MRKNFTQEIWAKKVNSQKRLDIETASIVNRQIVTMYDISILLQTLNDILYYCISTITQKTLTLT